MWRLQRTVVVIPARNEAATIGRVVSQVHRDVAPRSVLVIDDGSTDNTAELARQHGALVVQTGNEQGALGSAMALGVRTGLASGFDWFLTVDADGQYRPSDLVRLHARLTSTSDGLVVGNRLAGGRPTGMTVSRFGCNQLFNSAFGHVAGLTADLDAQSGMRAFTASTAEKSLGTNTFTYTQEQVLRATLAGHPVHSIPVHFGPRLSGSSRLVTSTIDYAARTVPHLVRIHRQSRRARADPPASLRGPATSTSDGYAPAVWRP